MDSGTAPPAYALARFGGPEPAVAHVMSEGGSARPGMTAAVLGICITLISSAHAEEPFVGRWAVTPEVCGGHGDNAKTSALVVTDSSLWWFDGYCRIGKMYKARAIYVQAHCGMKGDVPVTLDAHGDRMRVTWDRTKVEDLTRCK